MRLTIKKISAREIFLKSRRFDLIFKYLFLKNHFRFSSKTFFFEHCYCEHIKAFNGFHEEIPSDGIEKKTREEFLRRFLGIYESIKARGFHETISIIPVDEDHELIDGSHRIAVCTYLNLDVPVRYHPLEWHYDYTFFRKNGLDAFFTDYAAFEYTNFNRNAYIVNLHSISNNNNDSIVNSILNKYGFIFYKKDISLTFNGYVNLKKLSYGFDFQHNDHWIGNLENQFYGAQTHAIKSIGNNPLRAYIFVCDTPWKVRKAKDEIRELYGIGNYSVHINDNHEEAIRLAQIFFNENSLSVFNNYPFHHENKTLDFMLENLKKNMRAQQIDSDDLCIGGSAPLSIFSIRNNRDLDFLYCGEKPFHFCSADISNHDSCLQYYPYNKVEIIKNPRYHFYYNGLKFITLDILHQMKCNRNEQGKDVDDCKLIDDFRRDTNQ